MEYLSNFNFQQFPLCFRQYLQNWINNQLILIEQFALPVNKFPII